MIIDLEMKDMNLYDKIYLDNLKERRIILNDEVDASLYETVVMQIRKFNKEDEQNNIPINERKPIELYVNSYGGSAYDGYAIVNAIITSKTPVYTYADGYVMSMAFLIFIAGHRRFTYPFTNFMYHEVSTYSVGKNTEIEEVTKENRRIQAMYDLLVLKNTTLKKSQLDRVKKNKKDWFFGSEEALKYKVATDLIS